jgi:hypothetical protein
MTREQFAESLNRRPFRAFFIRTTDGEAYPVTHPEAIWTPEEVDSVMVIVNRRDRMVVATIDYSHIAATVYEFQVQGPASAPDPGA